MTTDIHTRFQSSNQFALFQRHVDRIRDVCMLSHPEVVVLCERNLGFEAEHLERATRGLYHVRHRIDHITKRLFIVYYQTIKREHV